MQSKAHHRAFKAILLTTTFVAGLSLTGGQVAHWGVLPFDSNSIPIVEDVVSVAAGWTHVLALSRDGRVHGWGAETSAEAPAGFSNVVAIAGGAYQSMALKDDGTVAAWGRVWNGWGSTPPMVPAGLSNVVAIAAGFAHGVALKADGTVTWWDSWSVQSPAHWTNIVGVTAVSAQTVLVRGDGSVFSFSPEGGEVSYEGWTNIVQVAASGYPVGLRSDGRLMARGGMDDALQVIGSITDATMASGAATHGCVLLRDGSVTNWGHVSRSGAVEIIRSPANLRKEAEVASGWDFDVALEGEGAPWISHQPAGRMIMAGGGVTHLFTRATGEGPLAYQWRFNGTELAGETNTVLTLGGATPLREGCYEVVVRNAHGSVTSRAAYVAAPAAVVAVEPREAVTYAGAKVKLTGSVIANGAYTLQWQFNGEDLPGETNAVLMLHSLTAQQAGDYSLEVATEYGTSVSAPIHVSISAVVAWGQDMSGETRVPAGLGDIVGVAAGWWHSVALGRDGRVQMWGNAGNGVEVPGGMSNVTAVAAGQAQSLALLADGHVVAWGQNIFGESTVPEGLSNAVAVGASIYNSMALKANGTALVWGMDNVGQMHIPERFTNLVEVAMGLSGGVGLKADGTVDTWGSTDWGFGDVPSDLSNAVAVACGQAHVLALKADGTLATWGSALTPRDGFVPSTVPEGLSNVVAIAASGQNNMALFRDGTVASWGAYNGNTFDAAYVPPGLHGVTAISAGSTHSLALVGEGLPFLTLPLIDREVLGGRNAAFYARATGAWPIHFQWRHNGTNLPGVTGPSLLLTNVQAWNAGSYSVVASNEFGAILSGECRFAVSPLYASLQYSNVVTFTGGTAFLLGVLRGN